MQLLGCLQLVSVDTQIWFYEYLYCFKYDYFIEEEEWNILLRMLGTLNLHIIYYL